MLCNAEAMFTKSVPSTMKMTVKGGAAVDPESGVQSDSVFFFMKHVCCYNYKCGLAFVHLQVNVGQVI